MNADQRGCSVGLGGEPSPISNPRISAFISGQFTSCDVGPVGLRETADSRYMLWRSVEESHVQHPSASRSRQVLSGISE